MKEFEDKERSEELEDAFKKKNPIKSVGKKQI
jgi:hypothetical protein